MEIEIIPTETLPRELLLSADENPASVDDYINRSHSYAARLNELTIGGYALLHTRPFTAEIINIAVAETHRRQGIGTRLLIHAISTARTAGFRILEIGTGDSGLGQIALYERCGFVRYAMDRDYFRKYYPAPIIENGIECLDMVRLRMELD